MGLKSGTPKKVKICPSCGLYNPNSAQICDCGYLLRQVLAKEPLSESMFKSLLHVVLTIFRFIAYILLICVFVVLLRHLFAFIIIKIFK
jgi:hypothetical protein